MAKKDDKKRKAEKKAQKAEKLAKKTAKTEKKASKKSHDADDSDADSDADLEAILAEYQKQQAQFIKVTETPVSEAPCRRSSAALVASPVHAGELFLFGGEYYDGARASFYNDLYVYRTAGDVWRRVTSPNTPLPRSGHAMCAGGNSSAVWLFGGEFSSPRQGTFHHYGDFWRLDPATREWTQLGDGKGGPPARSGHRMVAFRNYVVLFGGFQDTSSQTRYLQDVWLYDTLRFTWHCAVLPSASARPDARSSCSLFPHETGAVLYGGYSRVKASASVKTPAKGAKQAFSRTVMKPVVHQDTWFLRITPPTPEAPANAAPTVRWERRKKPVNTPNPSRAGATMAYHKGRGVLFGGVHDVEESEEGMDSEFFNLLYAYNIDRNRFFQLSLRRPRTSAKKSNPGTERSRRGRGKADEEELLRNLALIENKASLDDDRAVDVSMSGAREDDGDDDEDQKVTKPVAWEMPRPRFNAHLTVQEDILYIYGGTFEKGNREFTFDEMWSIDLGKLDGVREVFRRELPDWQGSEDEDSDGDDEDEEDSEEDEGDEEETPASSIVPEDGSSASVPDTNAEQPEPETESPSAPKDNLPMPRPFESLRDFFARTSTEWQDVILEAMKYERNAEDRSVKEIRKRAFDRAEDKWWDSREEIQALEDEQEAAGITEVVSLAERGGADGGAGRRR